MESQQKKSFASTQKMLKSALNGISKYSKHARRGFLIVVEDNTGLHKFGTRNLVTKYLESKCCSRCSQEKSWEEAAMEDTKNLNSEESSDAVNVAPETLDGQDILANLYQNNDIPKLPFPIDILSEKEAGAWLLPELKKDLVENGSKPVNRIIWGDEKFHPKCWADDIVPWSKVSNICHPQKVKLDVPINVALKASIRKRLEQKNINPDEYVDEKADQKKAKRKKLVRGIHDKKVTEDVPIDIVTEETPVNEEENSDEIVNEIIDTVDELLEKECSSTNNEEYVIASSDVFDISIERQDDGFGRRVLPSRSVTDNSCTEPTKTPSPAPAPSPPPSPASPCTSSQTPPKRLESPIVNLLPAAKRQRLHNPDSETSSSWSKGRGKGGKNLRVTRGRITSNSSKEKEREIKVLWKEWVKGYVEETNEMMKTNRGRHIVCGECSKEILVRSFLTHRTVNGCQNINPRIKLYNWM